MEEIMSVVPLVRPLREPAASVAIRVLLNLLRYAALAGARLTREIRVRRDMRRLAEFEDHMLRDIGITRVDIGRIVRNGRDR